LILIFEFSFNIPIKLFNCGLNLLTVSDCEFITSIEDFDFTVLHDLLGRLVVDEQLGWASTVQPGLDQGRELLVLHSMLLNN
jgi:hypothetical protein